MRLNTFKIIREIHLETKEEEEILFASHKMHNVIKLFMNDLQQHIKYEEDEMAQHYLNILQKYLKENDVDMLF